MADGSISIPSIQKMTKEEFNNIIENNGTPRFDAPFNLYKPKKDHYDF
jgi:predicted transcriptional regulator YdeE